MVFFEFIEQTMHTTKKLVVLGRESYGRMFLWKKERSARGVLQLFVCGEKDDVAAGDPIGHSFRV
jgi:hypothetical protein